MIVLAFRTQRRRSVADACGDNRLWQNPTYRRPSAWRGPQEGPLWPVLSGWVGKAVSLGTDSASDMWGAVSRARAILWAWPAAMSSPFGGIEVAQCPQASTAADHPPIPTSPHRRAPPPSTHSFHGQAKVPDHSTSRCISRIPRSCHADPSSPFDLLGRRAPSVYSQVIEAELESGRTKRVAECTSRNAGCHDASIFVLGGMGQFIVACPPVEPFVAFEAAWCGTPGPPRPPSHPFEEIANPSSAPTAPRACQLSTAPPPRGQARV